MKKIKEIWSLIKFAIITGTKMITDSMKKESQTYKEEKEQQEKTMTKKQQRKDMLKKYEGKLEGPHDHLKEGVDYLDDIQRNKEKKRFEQMMADVA